MKGDVARKPVPTTSDVRRFFQALPLGVKNAIVGRELAQRLELDPVHWDRELRALAEKAVLEYGLLVCTGNPGYWRPANRDEAGQSIGWKSAQAARMFERVRAEQQLIDAMFPAPVSESEVETIFEDIVGEPLDLFPPEPPADQEI